MDKSGKRSTPTPNADPQPPDDGFIAFGRLVLGIPKETAEEIRQQRGKLRPRASGAAEPSKAAGPADDCGPKSGKSGAPKG